MQDFREKNTDHMRPDIVALLKSSKNAFVCGLMGIDPTATFRWSVLRAYFRALVAFREAGRRHRQKKTGELAEEKAGTDRWRLRRGLQPYFVIRVLIRSSTEGSAKGKKKTKTMMTELVFVKRNVLTRIAGFFSFFLHAHTSCSPDWSSSSRHLASWLPCCVSVVSVV